MEGACTDVSGDGYRSEVQGTPFEGDDVVGSSGGDMEVLWFVADERDGYADRIV